VAHDLRLPRGLHAPTHLLDPLKLRKNGRSKSGFRVVEEPLEARGCELMFLPACSLDFSPPIEEAFSKLNALLRRGGPARRRPGRGHRADAVSGRDARGFFDHCGYPLRGQLP
jgi:hypothetical protein